MLKSFIYSSFNRKFKKRCLRLVLDDYESHYVKQIKKSVITTMKIKRLRTLPTKICKTINNINPSYMKKTFTPKANAKIKPYDIMVRHNDTASYVD